MNKLLFLLLLGTISIQINGIGMGDGDDQRPSKRQKPSEDPADLSFFDELQDIVDLENGNLIKDQEILTNQESSNPVENEDEKKEKAEWEQTILRNIKDLSQNELKEKVNELIFDFAEGKIPICTLDLLIKLGANIDSQRPILNDSTPLIMAVISFNDDFFDADPNNDCIERAKLLIEKGADVNIQQTEGYTALMWVVMEYKNKDQEFQNLDLISYLIDHGALLNIKNDYHKETALDLAKKYDYKEVIELLEKTIKQRIENFQKPISKEILDSTPLPTVLTKLTSQYLEGEY